MSLPAPISNQSSATSLDERSLACVHSVTSGLFQPKIQFTFTKPRRLVDCIYRDYLYTRSKMVAHLFSLFYTSTSYTNLPQRYRTTVVFSDVLTNNMHLVVNHSITYSTGIYVIFKKNYFYNFTTKTILLLNEPKLPSKIRVRLQ